MGAVLDSRSQRWLAAGSALPSGVASGDVVAEAWAGRP